MIKSYVKCRWCNEDLHGGGIWNTVNHEIECGVLNNLSDEWWDNHFKEKGVLSNSHLELSCGSASYKFINYLMKDSVKTRGKS